MAQLGVIGLGTMGANLARNAASRGIAVSVFNRTREKTDAFIASYGAEGAFTPCISLSEFCKSLKCTRVVLLMVQAGAAVDAVLKELTEYLDDGDIIIDGGNSLYRDTEHRMKTMEEKGIRFIGMGVSGGEEGALKGPSMMPGGEIKAMKEVLPMLQSMAADDGLGGKCVTHIGPGGAGHFVKMVHNGIEYAVMQLIAEIYDVLKTIGGYTDTQLAETFESWNTLPELQSFLVEITGKIFSAKDAKTGTSMVEMIKDIGGQKGTGKWTVAAAMEYGVAVPAITAAVEARILSTSTLLRTEGRKFPHVIDIHDPLPRPMKLRSLSASALELGVLLAYHQGFSLIKAASDAEGWKLDLPEIARIWRGGCIIRSHALGVFQQMYSSDSTAGREKFLHRLSGERQLDLRRIVGIGVSRGLPLAALAGSLAYLDALHRERLPQNLVLAQRDFFGAHGFPRTDKEGVFHGNWHGA